MTEQLIRRQRGLELTEMCFMSQQHVTEYFISLLPHYVELFLFNNTVKKKKQHGVFAVFLVAQ